MIHINSIVDNGNNYDKIMTNPYSLDSIFVLVGYSFIIVTDVAAHGLQVNSSWKYLTPGFKNTVYTMDSFAKG